MALSTKQLNLLSESHDVYARYITTASSVARMEAELPYVAIALPRQVWRVNERSWMSCAARRRTRSRHCSIHSSPTVPSESRTTSIGSELRR